MYKRIMALAEAELFDGSMERAAEIVDAFPGLVSIEQPDQYPTIEGEVTVDPAETGVEVTVEIVKEDIEHPYVITFDVTAGADATGELTIELFEEDPIVVEVTAEDDELTIAAAISLATFPGFTAVDNMDGTVTLTQDFADNTILAVATSKGKFSAIAGQYIAESSYIDGRKEIEIFDEDVFLQFFEEIIEEE